MSASGVISKSLLRVTLMGGVALTNEAVTARSAAGFLVADSSTVTGTVSVLVSPGAIVG